MVGLSVISTVQAINNDLKESGKYDQQMLSDLVYKFPTKHKDGFIDSEINDLIKLFDKFNKEKWHSAMMGITCMMDEKDGIITYHCDVLTGLRCALENRDQHLHEWD